MMIKEYVRLEEVIKILEHYDLSSGSTLGYHSGAIECAIAEIEMLPTVDVDEMFYCAQGDRKGDKTDECCDVHSAHWIKENDLCYDPDAHCFYAEYSCSYCGVWVNDRSGLPEYCPECGKEMEGEQ
jgi:hypothetical protein